MLVQAVCSEIVLSEVVVSLLPSSARHPKECDRNTPVVRDRALRVTLEVQVRRGTL